MHYDEFFKVQNSGNTVGYLSFNSPYVKTLLCCLRYWALVVIVFDGSLEHLFADNSNRDQYTAEPS